MTDGEWRATSRQRWLAGVLFALFLAAFVTFGVLLVAAPRDWLTHGFEVLGSAAFVVGVFLVGNVGGLIEGMNDLRSRLPGAVMGSTSIRALRLLGILYVVGGAVLATIGFAGLLRHR